MSSRGRFYRFGVAVCASALVACGGQKSDSKSFVLREESAHVSIDRPVVSAKSIPPKKVGSFVPHPCARVAGISKLRISEQPFPLLIPVIMYHDIIGDDVPQENPSRVANSDVTETAFKQQLCVLINSGYRALSLQEYFELQTGKLPRPRKAVLLTFDDGYMGNYELAFPIMSAFQVKASYFVVPATIGRMTSRNHFTWADLDLMEASGWVRAYSHSLTHARLTQLSESGIEQELKDSLRALERNLKLKEPRNFFAYPYGAWNESVVLKTKSLYRLGFGINKVQAGTSDPEFKIPRFAMTKALEKPADFARAFEKYLNEK